jgi:archaellum biogenesis protein FlaJ (TadC family)
VQLLDPRNPSKDFLRQEIESNRKSERWLVLNGAIALVLVAGLVVIRQLFFA